MREIKESMRSSTDEAIAEQAKGTKPNNPIGKPAQLKPSSPTSLMSPFTKVQHELEELIAGEDEALSQRMFSIPRPARNEPSPPVISGGSRCVWLGGIDPQLGEQDLREAFAPYGPIEGVRLVPQRECAFVYLSSPQVAQQAMQAMAGKALGRTIPRLGYGRQESPELAGGLPSRCLWVGHLAEGCREEEVWIAFQSYGAIENVRLLPSRNCAFVTFVEQQAAETAHRGMQGGRVGEAQAVRTGFAKQRGNNSPRDPLFSASTSTSSFTVSMLPSPFTSLFTSHSVQMSLKPSPFPSSPAIGSKLLHSPQMEFNHNNHSQPLQQQWHADDFVYPIPALPPYALHLPDFLAGPGTLKELRRMVEAGVEHMAPGEWELLLGQVQHYALAISIDPMGNILLQRVFERMHPGEQANLLTLLSPWLPTLGVHKHGTWVVQRLVQAAAESNAALRPLVADSLRPCLVALLQDQFGNYVVQGCLAFGADWIAIGLAWQCEVLGRSRFGARAMRSCLEVMSGGHKRTVATAILEHAACLASDPNGVLLLGWLADEPSLPGRHGLLLAALGKPLSLLLLGHKTAHGLLGKLAQQEEEPAALTLLAGEMATHVAPWLADPQAAGIVHRLLTNPRLPQPASLAKAILASKVELQQALRGECEKLLNADNRSQPPQQSQQPQLSTSISFGSIQATLQ